MSQATSRRFLFVAPPFIAHINPMASIAKELILRGNDVAWVAYDCMLPYLPEGSTILPGQANEAFASVIRDLQTNSQLATVEALAHFWSKVMAPLARAMLPDVEQAIADFEPEIMLVDQYTLAGAFAARKRGVTWATSSPSAELMTNLLDFIPSGKQWLISNLAALQDEFGMPRIEWPDRSPDLLLLYTTREFLGEELDLPAHYRMVGPSIGNRPDESSFPWHALNGDPLIFVTLGTLFHEQGDRFFATLIEALKDEPVQVIVSTLPELIPEPPPNFIVQRWVPLEALFPKLSAVICHAGTTAYEALAHGIPVVSAPIAYDQFTIADRIEKAGAGTRVRFRRVGPKEMSEAIIAVLNDPRYRAGAERVQASFRAAGGAQAAATALEALL